MIDCMICGHEMPGIHSDKIRQRCFECGGHSIVTWHGDKAGALEHLKRQGLMPIDYQFFIINPYRYGEQAQ